MEYMAEWLEQVKKYANAPSTLVNRELAWRKYCHWYTQLPKPIDKEILPISQRSLETYMWTQKAIKGYSYGYVKSLAWNLCIYVEDEGYPNPFKDNQKAIRKTLRAMLRIFGNDEEQAVPILEADEMRIRAGIDLTGLQGMRLDAFISVAKVLGRRHDSLANIRLKDIELFLFDSNKNAYGYPI